MSNGVYLTVKYSFIVSGHTVLCFDKELPRGWRKLLIDGKECKTEIAYDIPNAIGIEGEVNNATGKRVLFAS